MLMEDCIAASLMEMWYGSGECMQNVKDNAIIVSVGNLEQPLWNFPQSFHMSPAL